MVGLDDKKDRRSEVARAFEKLGIETYAIYKRSSGTGADGEASFHVYQHRAPVGELPDVLSLSDSLREFLGRRKTFVDFNAAPHEWALFFQQFELHRLERATGLRYLLPICLGRSVCGLLLLGDGEAEGKVCRDPVAETLGTFGLGSLQA